MIFLGVRLQKMVAFLTMKGLKKRVENIFLGEKKIPSKKNPNSLHKIKLKAL